MLDGRYIKWETPYLQILWWCFAFLIRSFVMAFRTLWEREIESKKNPVDRKKLQEKVWKMYTDGHWILFFFGLWTKESKEAISYGLLEANFIYVHQFSKRMAIKHYWYLSCTQGNFIDKIRQSQKVPKTKDDFTRWKLFFA